jgi:hypothetical protein
MDRVAGPVKRRLALLGWTITACVLLAACGGGSPRSVAPSSTAHPMAPPPTASTPMSTATSAISIPLDPTTQAQLVKSAVDYLVQTNPGVDNSLDFGGIEPGTSYYAYDPSTHTFWAGARLTAATDNGAVALQDADSYFLMEKPAGGSWTVYPTGFATGCPSNLPDGIKQIWHLELATSSGSCIPS